MGVRLVNPFPMTAKKLAILCIDDDPFYIELYRQILSAKGWVMRSAGNPDDGYAELKKRMPDALVLDVMMPEKGAFRDGYGLLERLREDPSTKKLPVVMVSALGSSEDAKHGMALGASSYLPKQEMMPQRLIEEIEKALKR
jgi:CheY-like chemotaxis protein